MTFSDKAVDYFCNLELPKIKNSDVSFINPYEDEEVKTSVKKYFLKFYNDESERLFVIGINPGRFGGGLTGISFTDPVALREKCGIENNLGERKELSSKFIYSVAAEFGGVKSFFSKLFLTALYPFALIKDGKNYNYYDEKVLANKLESAIVHNIREQIEFGAQRDIVILLGKKNADYFIPINEEQGFFKKIIILEHPRYIMQYRLKKIDEYIDKYIRAINQISV